MSAPNPSPGAMRAAAHIIDAVDALVDRLGGIIANRDKRIIGTAELIDRETAAPDLLSALKGMVEVFGVSEDCQQYKDAVKAINKAEGGAK